jgi:hypothetical protein
MGGCGCLALLAFAVGALVFFIYASTDPGPPIESLVLGAVTIVIVRALGVLGGPKRTAS